MSNLRSFRRRMRRFHSQGRGNAWAQQHREDDCRIVVDSKGVEYRELLTGQRVRVTK